MEFNEEDGIKLSEVAELIKEINKDTKEFREHCLESIVIPNIIIEKPESFTLSYVNGKYVVGIKPYCSFVLNEEGKVIQYHQNKDEADTKIAKQFLDKNYNTLNDILIHLNSNPPKYYVGYSDRKGYMSINFRQDNTFFSITDGTIEFNQPSTNTRIQYHVLKENIKSYIRGTIFELKKDDSSYDEVLSTIINIIIPKQILPDVIKTKLGMPEHMVKINSENDTNAIHKIEESKNNRMIEYYTKPGLPKKSINNELKGRMR